MGHQISLTGVQVGGWVMANYHCTPFVMNVTTQVSGSVTYNFETTNDNFWKYPQSGTINVTEVVTGSTVPEQFVITWPVNGYRFNVTAGTGTLTAQVSEAGLTNIGR